MFAKINDYYDRENYGIHLSTIEGHYWIEINIDKMKKINENIIAKLSQKNLEFLLITADLSSRGKAMIIRDLNKTQELLEDIKKYKNLSYNKTQNIPE